ncbi:MAG: hypothetical protein WC921_04350 [Candidatus Paceibacterota bacterium]|jgi:hypothetical protein
MKTFVGLLMLFFGILFLGFLIFQGAMGFYLYDKIIYSNWSLAEKASTISQKSEYIDKFSSALENSDLDNRYNTLFFPTPDNSFDENFKALTSLQDRLHGIKGLEENTPAYQIAMQQITEQQSQAGRMLSVFSGSWWQSNYYYLWNTYITTILITLSSMLIIFGMAVTFGKAEPYDE